MRILIATDGSEPSEYAVENTIKYSWPSASEFKVITVADNSYGPTSVREHQTSIMQEIVDRSVAKLKQGFGDKYKIEGQVLQGYPKSEIVKCAEYWPADLLIMGSRGRKGIKRIVLGSVSHSVLVAVGCSMRIARGLNVPSDIPHRILLSLDDSDESQAIVNRIALRSWLKGTEFLCAMAIPSLTQYFYDVQDSHEIDSLEILRNQKVNAIKERLETIAKSLQAQLPQCSVSSEVLNGDPRECIVEKAKQWGARLIVVGCKGKNWMDRMLIGSVSEAIATWADCSVEVIK